MGIYLLLSIMPVVVSLVFNEINIDDEKKKRYYCIICGAGLILVLGTRSRYMGADIPGYYNMMKNAVDSASLREYYNPDGVEIGFQFFIFALSRIFQNPQWLIFISTAIYVSSMIIFCYKYSSNIRLSIAMYICLGLLSFNMTAMRQSIAMSICLFAYIFADKKKLIPFAVLIILATLIHRTAIVFSLVYLLSYLKLKPLHIILVVIGVCVFLYCSQKLLAFANDFWGADRGLYAKEYTNKVLSGGYVATAIYILIFTFCIVVSKYPIKQNIDSTMFYVLIIGFVCYLERYISALIAERISFYFAFSQLILLPNTLENGRVNKKDKVAVEMVVYGLCILLYMYRLSTSDLIPFKFFWGDI